MGVDVNFYCVYGIEVDEVRFIEVYRDELKDKLFEKTIKNGKECILYNLDALDAINATVASDPYGDEWAVIGFRFLSGEPQELIDNLNEAQKNWYKLKEALEEALEKSVDDPAVMYEAYFD